MSRILTGVEELTPALTDLDSPFSVSPLARGLVACANTLPALLEALPHRRGRSLGTFSPDM